MPYPGSFKRLLKAMDPNETTVGYLQAVERDLKRLTLIERRLNRIEKMLVLLVKAHGDFNNHIEMLDRTVTELAAAQREAEENPYVPVAN